MIFIIEGPDGSGKTTLAETLSTQTGYPIIHRTQPKSDEEKAEMMESYIDVIKSGRNAIFDRCWYSEMVYGPVMRDTSVISYGQMQYLESILSKVGALIIYCTDVPEVLWQRATRRGEDYITDYATFLEICNGFETVMSMHHNIPVVKYGYKDVR